MYLIVLATCSVLLVTKLVSETFVSMTVFTCIACVQVVVDGNSNFWTKRYFVETGIQNWILLMNVPVLAAALIMTPSQRKRSKSDSAWYDGV